MLSSNHSIESILFIRNDIVVNTIDYSEFEAIVDGTQGLRPFKNQTLKAIYVTVEKSQTIHAIVLFLVKFDEQGQCTHRWNLPLRSLAQHTCGRIRMMNGNVVKLASKAQCPNPEFAEQLWDFPNHSVRRYLNLMKQAVFASVLAQRGRTRQALSKSSQHGRLKLTGTHNASLPPFKFQSASERQTHRQTHISVLNSLNHVGNVIVDRSIESSTDKGKELMALTTNKTEFPMPDNMSDTQNSEEQLKIIEQLKEIYKNEIQKIVQAHDLQVQYMNRKHCDKIEAIKKAYQAKSHEMQEFKQKMDEALNTELLNHQKTLHMEMKRSKEKTLKQQENLNEQLEMKKKLALQCDAQSKEIATLNKRLALLNKKLEHRTVKKGTFDDLQEKHTNLEIHFEKKVEESRGKDEQIRALQEELLAMQKEFDRLVLKNKSSNAPTQSNQVSAISKNKAINIDKEKKKAQEKTETITDKIETQEKNSDIEEKKENASVKTPISIDSIAKKYTEELNPKIEKADVEYLSQKDENSETQISALEPMKSHSPMVSYQPGRGHLIITADHVNELLDQSSVVTSLRSPARLNALEEGHNIDPPSDMLSVETVNQPKLIKQSDNEENLPSVVTSAQLSSIHPLVKSTPPTQDEETVQKALDEHHQAWIKHIEDPRCTAILLNGKPCGRCIPKMKREEEFVIGMSDRCEMHKRVTPFRINLNNPKTNSKTGK